MRRIVVMEFKPPRKSISDEWLNKEKRYIPEKIDNFVTLFFSPIINKIQNSVITIKNNFDDTSQIRNLFAHGHKIAKWSNSNGKTGTTKARCELTEIKLNKILDSVNDIGRSWNDILDEIIPTCQSLRCINDFKFALLTKNLDYLKRGEN